LDKDVSLLTLSQQARVTPFHFARLFRATVGMSLDITDPQQIKTAAEQRWSDLSSADNPNSPFFSYLLEYLLPACPIEERKPSPGLATI